MSQTNGGQIQVRRGLFSEQTCTTQNDLIANQAVKPAIRNMLEMTNTRYLATLLTSGAVKRGPGGNSYFVDPSTKTRTGSLQPAQEDKGIGNNAYRFDVMGRIERASVIVAQVGASGADGTFTLTMRDQALYPGHVVRFGSGFMARVQGYPTGTTNAWRYNFKSINGTAFVYSTHVGSNLSCFPMFTAYSEGSLRSDSRDKKPDTFVNHMTIQRKTCSITGGAQSDVLWYEYADGQKIGWLYWKLDQAQAIMKAEKERFAWWGVSSMKDPTTGALLAQSTLGVDAETGLPIQTGDGFEEQVSGTNTLVGSGTNGEVTADQFSDLMKTILKGSNAMDGVTVVFVTGLDGLANAAIQCQSITATQNIMLVQNVNQTSEQGGANVDVGFNYQSFNINGSKALFITHSMLDDEDMFPARGNDGKLLSSSTYYGVAMAGREKPTMEILCKEANGVKRDYVEAKLIGLSGAAGQVITEADVNKFAMLSESMFNVYNVNMACIAYKGN